MLKTPALSLQKGKQQSQSLRKHKFSVGCFGIHFNHWAWGSHNLGLTALKGLCPLTCVP